MNGVLRGIQLIADFFALMLKAIETGNLPALQAGAYVIRTWLADTVNSTGAVKISSWSLLLGADPWQNSRKAYQNFALQWQGKL